MSDEPLTEGSGDELIVSAPSKPAEVADEFLRARYADKRGSLLLHHRGLFHRWVGTHWVEAETSGIESQAQTWLRRASYMKKVGKGWALAPFDPTRGKLGNTSYALARLTEVHVCERIERPAWLNGTTPPWPSGQLIAMKNGLLHLPTRELIPHTPCYFNEFALPFEFNPNAPPPKRWHQFLHEQWGDDQQTIDVLAEIMGYILSGDTSQQKLFLFPGPKRSGRGTLARVLRALLGPENYCGPTLSSLTTNFGLQELIGRPLAVIADARLSSRADSTIAVERLLSVSGEDTLTIDRKYQDPWTGRLPTRILILTNELPKLDDASGTIASRFVILPWTVSFYGREDPTLTNQLITEPDGIFNWCLAGLDRLTKRGHFVQPPGGEDLLRQLEDLASPVAAFVRDRCEIALENEISKDALFAEWKDWCAEEGHRPGSKDVFMRDLRAAFPKVSPHRLRHNGKRQHVLSGIAVDYQKATGTTTGETPDRPDQPHPEDTEQRSGQGGQGSTQLLLHGNRSTKETS